jgi:pimeloyl-ACP methyl ester carboxylesterase
VQPSAGRSPAAQCGRGWLALVLVAMLASCARLPEISITPLQPETLGKLQQHLLDHVPDVDLFRLRGPFEVTQQEDVELESTANGATVGDLFLSSAKEKAPLVVLLHGYGNSRLDHAYQAYHLATWGLHSLTVDLPNEGPWIGHGKTLARLVGQLRRGMPALDPRVDRERIVLAGHSFGGAAVAVAVAQGAPVKGAILLDPASEFGELPGHLARVRKPVMIVGADPYLSMTKNRDDFFHYLPGNVFEVSVARAHHQDAEFAFDSVLDIFDASAATRALQITFASALTSAAFSIGFTGGLDYVWNSTYEAAREGKLIGRMRK